MPKRTDKLGDDPFYIRPTKTMQDNLTTEEIQEKLKGYVQVENIGDVEINTHIRYFTTDNNGNKLFRLGGFLQNKRDCQTYVMVTNGKLTWSVQTKGTVFFRKQTHKEEIETIKRVYMAKLKEKDNQIKLLNQKILKLEHKKLIKK
jgi:hypothetical protein